MALKFVLDIGKEEGFIFFDGTADRTAKLIQIELLGIGGEIAAGVELGIAKEFKDRAVKTVGTGLSGNEDGGAGARAPFGGVIVSENLEFLNGVDRGQDGYTAAGEFVVVVPIEKPVGRIGAGAADGEREGTASRDLAARAAIEKAAGIGFLGGTGGEGGELDEIAAVEGEIGNLLGGDDLAEGGIGGLDGNGSGSDFDACLNVGWRQIEVDFALFIDLQANIFDFAGLEAGVLRAHGEGADAQKRNYVVAAGV